MRPPPSKTNHPLNLQVQLVPPNAKPPGGVTGTDDTSTAPTTPTSGNSANSKLTSDGAPLARTSSSRSFVSYTSTYGSSTTSFSSFSSTSARRTIIPLYNLQAHNVMTNVIVDAGTDAKIAKFQKRGIELIDLALLEPVEVWGEGGREKDARRESMRIVADEMGASVVVNNSRGKMGAGISAPKVLTQFLSGGSRPTTPSAASSATSLHSQIALAQTPIPQRLSSQTMATDQQYDYRPPRSATSDIFPTSHPTSISGSSNNLTLIPPASPVPMTSMSLAMISPPASPAPGTGKRNLFNKLFNKRQNGSNLLSPSGSSFPGSPGQQQQPPGYPPDLEVSPPPTFTSFTLSPAPVTNKATSIAANTGRSFSSRSNSMKRRSAVPPALVEPAPFSPFTTSESASPSPGVGSMTTQNEQQTTPTQMSVAAGAKKKITAVSSPTSVPREREREKGHGRGVSLTSITSPFKSTLKSRLSSVVTGSQSNLQARNSESSVDDAPTPSNKKGNDRDRDASPHRSLSSNDKPESQSRSSLLGTSSTNNSADSCGVVSIGNGSFGTGGHGQMLPQVVMTPAQTQSDIMMNLRQQQLQLRPPVLGIQPTFVTSSPPSAPSNPSNLCPPDGPSTTTTENSDQLIGQRALMYVWLVRRWMKKRSSGLVGFSGLGDSAVGFLGGVVGGVVGGLKGEKEKERGKERVKDRKRSDSGEYRPESSSGGLTAVTAPLMYGGVEVRFEWKRTKAGKEKGGSRKKKSRNGRGRTATVNSEGAESDGEVETSNRQRERDDRDERGSIRGGGGSTKTKERVKSEEKKKYRMSTGSIKSIAANSVIDGEEFEAKKKNQYDDGEDSEPEDSETPWICTLKLRRGATPAAGGNPAAGDTQPQPAILQTEVLRIKVGTLSPTPHHPKVVAMLKVPFPLPDVEVERMGVVKRQGVIPPQNPTYNGLVLTAEEIKDVVCSTGLWLVVREGFGGVGRVSRKGDGWRIRA